MACGIDFYGKGGCFKRRTKLEGQLIVVTGIILILSVGLVLYLAAVMSRASKLSEERICVSAGCIHAASYVLKTIDSSIDPCDDFYQFACGGFVKKTNIPEDKSTVSAFSVVRDAVLEQLKTIVNEEFKPTAPKQYHFIKQIYGLCMNTTAIESVGIHLALKIFKDLGGWPILEGQNWNENAFDWKQVSYKLRKLGFTSSALVSFYVSADLKNSTTRIITVNEASTGLSREFLIKGIQDPLVKGYYDYMVDIAVLYGAKREDALRELKETLEFEMKVAHMKVTREEARNVTRFYNRMTFRDLQQNYPVLDWVEYINNIIDLPNITINEDEPVIVAVPEFLIKMDQLTRQTPKRVIANYLMRFIGFSLVRYLPEEFRKRAFVFNKIVSGVTQEPPRWKECLGLAHAHARYPIEATYVRKFFDSKSKHGVEEIVSDVRAEFSKLLKHVEWMDDTTKANAIDKLASISAYVGYPDELLDDKNVEEIYSKMEFTTQSYFKAMSDLRLFWLNYSFGEMRKPIDRADWKMRATASTVNAFYSSSTNSIRLPSGILQGVFFDADRPQYMNYAGIGGVVGHELTHGFDDRGRQFDKEGNLVDWWANATKTAFIKKAQCIIDQYSNFTEPESQLNLNGINTQGENIADNGAVIQSYLAYQSWVERHGVEAKLPGLDFTQNQLFWITAAHTECDKDRKEELKIQVITGAHSPGMFRVIGPFSNNVFFAKDFKCPSGSKMNPSKKCRVW